MTDPTEQELAEWVAKKLKWPESVDGDGETSWPVYAPRIELKCLGMIHRTLSGYYLNPKVLTTFIFHSDYAPLVNHLIQSHMEGEGFEWNQDSSFPQDREYESIFMRNATQDLQGLYDATEFKCTHKNKWIAKTLAAWLALEGK